VKLSDFDYPLPEELIAQEPVAPRDASRLLVVPRDGAPLREALFSDLPGLLRVGDLLVVNDTRVLPARLLGTKASGGRCELLLVEDLPGEGDRWRALGRASKPIRSGARLTFGDLAATVEAAEGDGFFTIRFDRTGPALAEALERAGEMPLPPYIRRRPTPGDRERYQTVMARVPGSAAAPTAGLHLTEPLLRRISEAGVERTAITLHVGPGTFLPVRSEDVAKHHMHEERYFVREEAARAFEACRARGGRVIAVGTTVARTLESACDSGMLRVGPGRTALFITPGHAFRAVDGLVTNLHLPRSTLLMLVCAFGGRERVLHAYAHAIKERYRFFSYGDAMLLA
jgi:S-adenosylmethionine:tRNA ribosyltransferase-isomerase